MRILISSSLVKTASRYDNLGPIYCRYAKRGCRENPPSETTLCQESAACDNLDFGSQKKSLFFIFFFFCPFWHLTNPYLSETEGCAKILRTLTPAVLVVRLCVWVASVVSTGESGNNFVFYFAFWPKLASYLMRFEAIRAFGVDFSDGSLRSDVSPPAVSLELPGVLYGARWWKNSLLFRILIQISIVPIEIWTNMGISGRLCTCFSQVWHAPTYTYIII